MPIACPPPSPAMDDVRGVSGKARTQMSWPSDISRSVSSEAKGPGGCPSRPFVRHEGWKDGRVEGWKGGRTERRRDGGTENGKTEGMVVTVNDSTNLYVLDIVGSIALDKVTKLFTTLDDSSDIGKKIKDFTKKH